jgi:hypothetical protein
MGAIMLTENWERLRGYDKWIQTEATILSSELTEPDAGLERNEKRSNLGSPFQWHSTCTIGWTDVSGISHKGSYTVPELSPLFQLYQGQTVPIRYNPACPGEYYLHELCINKAASTLKRTLFIAYFAFFLIWFAHELWRHFH